MQDLILLLLVIAIVGYIFFRIKKEDLKDEQTNNVPNHMKNVLPTDYYSCKRMYDGEENEWGHYMNG